MDTVNPTPAENIAAQIRAWHPGREREWAVENIRSIAEADYYDDATARRLILDVLSGLDLAVR